MPLRTAAVLLAVLALAGCNREGDTPASGERAEPAAETAESGTVELVEGDPDGALPSGAPFVSGTELVGAGESEIELAGSVHAPFVGTLAPPAVPDGEGRRIAYNAWARGAPVLRLHDLEAGTDEVVARRAFAPAWRADGALAHVRGGSGPRHVVVRREPEAEATRWTRARGMYVVAAWAGERLLVYRIRGTEADVLVFDGSREPRVLAENSFLVAVSPEGARAFVAERSTPPRLRVLDLATGDELARTAFEEVDPNTEQPIASVGDAGSWVGDLVAAPAPPHLVVFRVAEDAIAVEQVLFFDMLDFPAGVLEPRLADDGRRIVAWGQLANLDPTRAEAASDAAVIECDRFELRCVEGRRASFYGSPPRPVWNPSRPASE